MNCFKCGKKALIDGLCRDCYLQDNELFMVEDDEVKICKNCGKFYLGEWIEGNFVSKYLEKNFEKYMFGLIIIVAKKE